MNSKHLIMIALIALGTGTEAMAQKKATKSKNARTSVSADSLEVRKLTDAAKKGDADSQNTLGTYYYTGKKVKRNYDIALKWYSMAAKQRHVKAIANMGLCYQLGNGIKKDSLMAVKLYKESIKRGNAELVKLREENLVKSKSAFDINLLADLYEHGCGNTIKKNPETALKYYKMAAANGLLEAVVKVAKAYDGKKKYAEALPYFIKAADKGDGYSEYKYGDYLCNGKGIKVDKAKAVAYLDKAVKHNIPNAMMMMGDLLYKGDGVEQDYSKAMAIYQQAAVKGNPAAFWNIGIMYKNGLGVKENYLIALQWLATAADKGMKTNFQKQLLETNVEINNGWKNTDFYTFLHAVSLMEAATPDYSNAVKELTALEKKGVVVASSLLGRCYADKSWNKASIKKMLAYYENAANTGEPYACMLLAQLYMTGDKFVKTDKSKVISYYQKASEAGYAPAKCELGNLYFTGKLVNKNISEAIKYYHEALLGGYMSKEAADNLASCYQQGLGGVKKNSSIAQDIAKKGQKEMPWTKLLQSVSFE